MNLSIDGSIDFDSMAIGRVVYSIPGDEFPVWFPCAIDAEWHTWDTAYGMWYPGWARAHNAFAVLALTNDVHVRLLATSPLDLDTVVVSFSLERDRAQRVRGGILGIMFAQVLIHLVVLIQRSENVLLFGDHAKGTRRSDQSLDVKFIGVFE